MRRCGIMPVIKECAFCKRQFSSKPNIDKKYCAMNCFRKYQKTKRTFLCTGCKSTFVIPIGRTKKNDRPFCSKECWDRFQVRDKNPHWKGIREEVPCKQCNVPFLVTTTKRKGTAKFCSIKCRTVYHKINGAPSDKKLYDLCLFCKAEIKIGRIKKLGKRNFCGRECADAAHSLYLRGDKNGRYINGAYESKYAPGWTRKLKDTIRQTLGLQCKICGVSQSVNNILHVHHIDGEKDNHSPNNLITLCKHCHRRTHGAKVKEEWKEKLSNL